MSHEPGALPLGLELDENRYWCGPGDTHVLQELPTLSYTAFGLRLLSSTWIRALFRSATYTLPCKSTAIPCGRLNWPTSDPRISLPSCARNRPFLSYLTTRWLTYPSATKILPCGSHATSDGRPNTYF